MVFLVLLMLAACSGLFLYVHYKPQLSTLSLKKNMMTKLNLWLPNIFHKEKMHPPVKKVAAVESETIKPIHFDFYDELPKDGMGLAKNKPIEELDSAESEETPAPVLKKSLVLSVKPIKDHDELEQSIEKELASDLSNIQAADHSSYIIQVSVFPTLEAAKRYRAALAKAGLKVDLVKIRAGKGVAYRLQQGPYHDLDQVKAAKKQLTERGVTCDVRKMAPYLS